MRFISMRFSIEQRHLTGASGKPVSRDGHEVSFHVLDAESAEDAVRLHICGEAGEVIGNVMRFPGFQAVATMRSAGGVYTLQVSPASGVRV